MWAYAQLADITTAINDASGELTNGVMPSLTEMFAGLLVISLAAAAVRVLVNKS